VVDYLKKLQEMAEEVETQKAYEGYFYTVSTEVTILVIGLLCSLKTSHEIYQWSQSKAVRQMLMEYVGMERFLCYAQFMNILGNVLAVKENQKDLYSDIKLYFETESPTLEKHSKSEKGHGRIEKRTATVTHDVQWYESSDKWTNLACFGAVRRICEENGKTSDDVRYYISSRKLSAEELLKYSRNEWAVESMHWSLDVVFNEDKTLLIEKDALRSLNTLRKTALNLVKLYKSAIKPKSSLVGIMRVNLFDASNIPLFFQRLGAVQLFWRN